MCANDEKKFFTRKHLLVNYTNWTISKHMEKIDENKNVIN